MREPTRSGGGYQMLEQLTYVQIGERLNISSEGARAIVKRNRLPRSHDKHGKTLVAIDLDELQHKPLPVRAPRLQAGERCVCHTQGEDRAARSRAGRPGTGRTTSMNANARTCWPGAMRV